MQSKRKKVVKYRGSKTHGCGSMKKRRGAGNRGGRGMAGSGKRGDSKKPLIWKNKKYFGKYGFDNKNKSIVIKMNIRDLEAKIDELRSKNILTEENGKLVVELNKYGITKLLSMGKPNHAFIVNVSLASKKAIEKIEAAGGKVNLMSTAGLSVETSNQKAKSKSDNKDGNE